MANMEKLQAHSRISLGVLAVGLILMAYMSTFESEPGALPLLMVLLGLGGYCLSRYRISKQ